MLFGVLVVYHGVSRGIERANKILIPALFAILVIGAVRALTLSGPGLAGVPFSWGDRGLMYTWRIP